MKSTRLFFDVDQAIFLARDDADGASSKVNICSGS